MDDQVSALKQNKVSAERLHSHMTDTENKEIWDSFCNGNIKILYSIPEALMSSSKLEVIKTLDIGLFVIDNATLYLNGDQALEKTTRLYLGFKEIFPNANISAFTATADKATRRYYGKTN